MFVQHSYSGGIEIDDAIDSDSLGSKYFFLRCQLASDGGCAGCESKASSAPWMPVVCKNTNPQGSHVEERGGGHGYSSWRSS
jgi:hypothetical protein